MRGDLYYRTQTYFGGFWDLYYRTRVYFVGFWNLYYLAWVARPALYSRTQICLRLDVYVMTMFLRVLERSVGGWALWALTGVYFGQREDGRGVGELPDGREAGAGSWGPLHPAPPLFCLEMLEGWGSWGGPGRWAWGGAARMASSREGVLGRAPCRVGLARPG